jgi:plastocyanin domain-containing protein
MKGITPIVIIAIGFMGLIFFLGKNNDRNIEPVESTVIEGEMSVASQVIDIRAKGGYSPRVITAKAGIPTTLKVVTSGTFDCSAALTIPSIGYRGVLPPSGVTEIAVPPQASGTTLQGLCQMGMYNFEVRFN